MVGENFQQWMTGKKLLASRHHFQWGRKSFHVANSLFGLWLYVFSGASDRFVILFLAGYFAFNLTIDLARKKFPKFNEKICRSFAGIMREDERNRISSASWYLGSILAIMLLFPKDVVILCVLFVAFGDTAAGIIGVYLGRHKISPRISLEGLAAGFVACFLSTWLFTLFWLPNFRLFGLRAVGFSLAAATIGTAAEALYKKLDDNLMIPVLSAPLVFVLMLFFK